MHWRKRVDNVRRDVGRTTDEMACETCQSTSQLLWLWRDTASLRGSTVLVGAYGIVLTLQSYSQLAWSSAVYLVLLACVVGFRLLAGYDDSEKKALQATMSFVALDYASCAASGGRMSGPEVAIVGAVALIFACRAVYDRNAPSTNRVQETRTLH